MDFNVSLDEPKEPQYKPLLVSHSRMMSSQSGRQSRFHRIKKEKNEQIKQHNEKLKIDYENSKTDYENSKIHYENK